MSLWHKRDRRKVRKTFEITIDATFGSQFQSDAFDESLFIVLKALGDLFRAKHQDNRITTTIAEVTKKY